MISKPLAFGLLVAGCVLAAAGGAYVAVRQNAPSQPAVIGAPAATDTGAQASKPVAETEAIVTSKPAEAPALEAAPVAAAPASRTPDRPRERAANEPRRAPRATREAAREQPPAASAERPAPVEPPAQAPPTLPEPLPAEPPRQVEPPAVVEREFEEAVVPASSVIGLQVTTSLSSERTQVEDRVEARVTRDVTAAGRVAIPAGSRVIGSVTLVERGGKVKERARLGVRFHTLVLADGAEQSLRTEAIFREGEPPSGESARKIGGAAVGGAILGAIIGGGKGAAIGGATGAAGGTAAVMAGGRNPATLPSGTIVNVRLTTPLTIDVPRDK